MNEGELNGCGSDTFQSTNFQIVYDFYFVWKHENF
jgi:hypothetical protein